MAAVEERAKTAGSPQREEEISSREEDEESETSEVNLGNVVDGIVDMCLQLFLGTRDSVREAKRRMKLLFGRLDILATPCVVAEFEEILEDVYRASNEIPAKLLNHASEVMRLRKGYEEALKALRSLRAEAMVVNKKLEASMAAAAPASPREAEDAKKLLQRETSALLKLSVPYAGSEAQARKKGKEAVRDIHNFYSVERPSSESLLHLEQKIAHFSLELKPRDEDETLRRKSIMALKALIKKMDDAADVRPFGSWLSGMCTRKSDLDISVTLPCRDLNDREELKSKVMKLAAFLRHFGIPDAWGIRARVPIVRCTDPIGEGELDITVNNRLGAIKSILFREYVLFDDRVWPLVVIVKEWAKNRGLCDAHFGGLNSYGFTLLVIAFLQCVVQPPVLPNLLKLTTPVDPLERNSICEKDAVYGHQEGKNFLAERNTESVAQLLWRFFDYYGNCHDFRNDVVCVRFGKITPISTMAGEVHFTSGGHKWAFIEDPLEPEVNVGRSLGEGDLMLLIGELRRAQKCCFAGDLGKLLESSSRADGIAKKREREIIQNQKTLRRGRPFRDDSPDVGEGAFQKRLGKQRTKESNNETETESSVEKANSRVRSKVAAEETGLRSTASTTTAGADGTSVDFENRTSDEKDSMVSGKPPVKNTRSRGKESRTRKVKVEFPESVQSRDEDCDDEMEEIVFGDALAEEAMRSDSSCRVRSLSFSSSHSRTRSEITEDSSRATAASAPSRQQRNETAQETTSTRRGRGRKRSRKPRKSGDIPLSKDPLSAKEHGSQQGEGVSNVEKEKAGRPSLPQSDAREHESGKEIDQDKGKGRGRGRGFGGRGRGRGRGARGGRGGGGRGKGNAENRATNQE